MRRHTQIVYRNDKFGFTLRFPRWWRNYCVISRARQDRETEYELHFRFKHKGKVYDDIWGLYVFRLTKQQWINQGYQDSPLQFLAEYEGRVFAYVTPQELPRAFVDDKTGDYNYKKYGTAIELLKRMVSQDVPRIAHSLRFPRTTITMRSTPYRFRKMRPCGEKRKH